MKKTKQIAIIPLSDEFKDCVNNIINALSDLKIEIENKQSDIVQKSMEIKQAVDALIESNSVDVDTAEYKKSEESIKRYTLLLQSIIGEISDEIQHYSSIITMQPAEFITVQGTDPDSLDAYLIEKTTFVKRYVKTIKRDLSISFSRYSFGFDSQMKRIKHIQSYLAHATKAKTMNE